MATLVAADRFGSAVREIVGSGPGECVWLDPELGLVWGAYPKARARFDFALERVVEINNAKPAAKKVVNLWPAAKRLGEPHEIETGDAIYKLASATQALIEGLNILEDAAPGLMARLAKDKKRTRRMVAKSPDELFDLKHLAKYSARLKCGYYVCTNNDSHWSRGYLREAAKAAGLETSFAVRAVTQG